MLFTPLILLCGLCYTNTLQHGALLCLGMRLLLVSQGDNTIVISLHNFRYHGGFRGWRPSLYSGESLYYKAHFLYILSSRFHSIQ